jgi:hypothetical protein
MSSLYTPIEEKAIDLKITWLDACIYDGFEGSLVEFTRASTSPTAAPVIDPPVHEWFKNQRGKPGHCIDCGMMIPAERLAYCKKKGWTARRCESCSAKAGTSVRPGVWGVAPVPSR